MAGREEAAGMLGKASESKNTSLGPPRPLWKPRHPTKGGEGGREGKELAQACSRQEPIVQATELEISNLKVRDRSPPMG